MHGTEPHDFYVVLSSQNPGIVKIYECKFTNLWLKLMTFKCSIYTTAYMLLCVILYNVVWAGGLKVQRNHLRFECMSASSYRVVFLHLRS